jgi:hypothetical protein
MQRLLADLVGVEYCANTHPRSGSARGSQRCKVVHPQSHKFCTPAERVLPGHIPPAND